MSGRSVNLTTLFLGRLRPPKQFTSTLCTYFHQYLTTALVEKAEGETKVCCQTGYRTQDPWLTSQVPYRLRYAAHLLILFAEKGFTFSKDTCNPFLDLFISHFVVGTTLKWKNWLPGVNSLRALEQIPSFLSTHQFPSDTFSTVEVRSIMNFWTCKRV